MTAWVLYLERAAVAAAEAEVAGWGVLGEGIPHVPLAPAPPSRRVLVTLPSCTAYPLAGVIAKRPEFSLQVISFGVCLLFLTVLCVRVWLRRVQ